MNLFALSSNRSLVMLPSVHKVQIGILLFLAIYSEGRYSVDTSIHSHSLSEDRNMTIETEDWIGNFTKHHDHHKSGHRHMFKRAANPEVKNYFMACGRTIDLKDSFVFNIYSLFNGRKQYLAGTRCDWTFLGGPECIPQISCDTVDLRTANNPNCASEHLLIYDGVDGWVRWCDINLPRKPLTSSLGYDLFLTLITSPNQQFTRLFKGIKCTVSCYKLGQADKLPEQKGLLSEESRCQCGIGPPAFLPKIVGGSQTRPFEYPWLVAIVRPGSRSVVCGGSIINSKYILTAAHCFSRCKGCAETVRSSNRQVLVHMHNQKTSDVAEGTLRIPILRVTCHPNYYKLKKHDLDVCILELDRHMDIIKHHPICLPPPNYNFDEAAHRTVTIAGWGKTLEGGTASGVLLKSSITLFPDSLCVTYIGRYSYVVNHMLCAGFVEGGADSCQGDSGGPLMYPRAVVAGGRLQLLQLGLVSWGYGCGRPYSPGVYASLPVVAPWIRRVAMDGKWCSV